MDYTSMEQQVATVLFISGAGIKLAVLVQIILRVEVDKSRQDAPIESAEYGDGGGKKWTSAPILNLTSCGG